MVKMEVTPNGRGGAREGAGRPPTYPEGPTMQITISIPAVMVDRLDKLAKENEMSRSSIACALLRKMLSE